MEGLGVSFELFQNHYCDSRATLHIESIDSQPSVSKIFFFFFSYASRDEVQVGIGTQISLKIGKLNFRLPSVGAYITAEASVIHLLVQHLFIYPS